VLSNFSFILFSFQFEGGGDRYANRDKVDQRPNISTEVHFYERVIDGCRDAENPYPSYLFFFKGLESQEGENSTRHPTKQNIVAVGILWIQSNDEHYRCNGLGNPDGALFIHL